MGGPKDPVGIKESVAFSLKRGTPPKPKTLIPKIIERIKGVFLYIISSSSRENSDDEDEEDGGYLISYIPIRVDYFNPFFIS